MLLELAIENFALIKKLDICFHEGLNILTGETGAGKSIIIDAVNMAIGERADKNYIRSGADKAIVQVVFRSQNSQLQQLLLDNGIDILDDDSIILTRELYSNGRNTSRINDKLVTASLVKEVSKFLIDIHGQHAHQSLLYSENHIDILDSFQEKEVVELKEKVVKKYFELKELEDKLNYLYGDELERERKKDLLKFQIDEIDECNFIIDEEEKLLADHSLLSNYEKIFKIIVDAYEKIYHGNEKYLSIIDGLGSIVSNLEDIKNFDSKLFNIWEVLQDCLFKIEDIARDIRNYRDNTEFNPYALEEIENRLDLINRMKRKYGKTIKDILLYREKIYAELETIENSEATIKMLNKKIQKTSSELFELSTKLSEKRKSIACQLEAKMMKELLDLNMKNVNFKVNFIKNVDNNGKINFTTKGIDKIEFLISTNIGEQPKPLVKIASGGEISRIMLAIKSILAKTDNIPTLIFDEIDTGISGRTANLIGEKLAIISKTHQILCITHLPQIACMADQHYYIEKIFQENSTLTNITRLQEKDRIIELGRLLGGPIITDLTLKHAKEMLNLGNQFKKSVS